MKIKFKILYIGFFITTLHGDKIGYINKAIDVAKKVNSYRQQIQSCTFCDITNGLKEANVIYQTNKCLVIDQTNPLLPHIKKSFLIISKKHIPTIKELTDEDALLISELFLTITSLAEQFELQNFQVQINTGAKAGESVHHLHIFVTAIY